MLKKIVILLFIYKTVSAQNDYPQGYFMMPIEPGQNTSLAGCFGDIRINHFHAGIDVRTGGREGKNVYAAADGYISRIRIQNGGYGNSLYITHLNGLTTVYAHLKVFNESIQAYLVRKQYENKTWAIDLKLEPNELIVEKGNVIALSGNTGGSAGPHLHFEIRDSEENVLDPSKFGFYDLFDSNPPVIEQISIKCLSPDARIEGNFGTFTYPVLKHHDGTYSLTKKIHAKGILGIELLVYDKANKSPFRQGISTINLKVNDEKTFRFHLHKMSFENRLDMNLHVNYEKLVKHGQKIHKCYVEEGNTFDIYETNDLNGKFQIQTDTTNVNIQVLDAFDNVATLNFNIFTDSDVMKPYYERTRIKLEDNFLKFEINNEDNHNPTVQLMINNNMKAFNLPESNNSLWIYDLKNGVPEKIVIDNQEFECPINLMLTEKTKNLQFQSFNANFKGALFNNTFVNFSGNESKLFLYEDIVPMKDTAIITWKQGFVPNNAEKYKVYLEGNRTKFIGGQWEGTNIVFPIKEFGTYFLKYDEEPPLVFARAVNKNGLSFNISDKISGIKSFNCWVNNEWVLMNYEFKNGHIWSEKLDKSLAFYGNVRLEVIDKCDNITVYETNIPEL